MKLRKNQLKPLRYDLSGAVHEQHGIAPAELSALIPRLSSLRDQLLSDPNRTQHADFIQLPKRLLAEYSQYRQTGTLGRIFQRANRIQSLADRVVILGNRGVCVGPRLILEACCQPHWNELSRGERGSKPRMYFDTQIPDNDAMQALLHLLASHRPRSDDRSLDRWGLVPLVPEASDGTVHLPAALPAFVSALQSQASIEPDDAFELLTAIAPADGQLNSVLQSLGLSSSFCIDSLVDAPYTALSPVGLFPAAILGVNVMELIQGAAWMSEYFAQADDQENIVFQMAAAHYLLSTRRGIRVRTMRLWNAGLTSFGEWYSDLVAETLSDSGANSIPVTVVTTVAFSHRASTSRSNAGEQAIHHIYVESPRFDPLAIGPSTLPNLVRTELEDSDTALRTTGHLTTKLTLPILDELHLGQLLQLVMLATLLESQLRIAS